MDKYFIEKLNNIIKEYRIWQKQLKEDIEMFDDTATKEELATLRTLKVVIQDLKSLKQIYNRKRK